MRKVLLAAVVFVGCTEATNTSIQVAFNIPATDELSTTVSGVCTFTPVTQAGGQYKPSGFLEMDPLINPIPEYVLGLQVENYLDLSTLTDSNGTLLVGTQKNDFHVQRAIVKYDDVQGLLPPIEPVTVVMSADVRAGGLQSATAVPVQAFPTSVISQWEPSFDPLKMGSLAAALIILQIQFAGVLSSGEQVSSGIFEFPVTLCWDCFGISPAALPGKSTGCPVGSTPVPSGHGPCCAAQDFSETCVPCGAAGQACCGAGHGPPCTTGNACNGTPAGQGEICPYINAQSVVCAKST